jgi:dephospho-CoA kinase
MISGSNAPISSILKSRRCLRRVNHENRLPKEDFVVTSSSSITQVKKTFQQCCDPKGDTGMFEY